MRHVRHINLVADQNKVHLGAENQILLVVRVGDVWERVVEDSELLGDLLLLEVL